MPVPRATYRLQLHAGFGFDEAAAVAGYLSSLGVSHVYCSPYLQAAPGSTHGYDVVDHSRINAELGGEEGHLRFCRALSDTGLGQILDLVPNHMAIGPENSWWTDVLENGPSSRYASYFDVDWDPPESKLRNRVLLPILGDHYGRVLEAGEFSLRRIAGSFVVRHFDHRFPLAPRSYDVPLALAAREASSDVLAFFASAFTNLPPATALDSTSRLSRHRDKEILKSMLADACRDQPDLAAAVDAAVATINGDIDLLDAVLDRQNFRLAHWRTAGEELDYRRFFDVTTLAGLRVEDDEVFDDTHRLVLGFLSEGVLDGLRIDHPDGLVDPGVYLERLASAAPEAWIVIEKILEPGEALPSDWPVAGTTGYDFANLVGGLFVDPDGEAELSSAYADFSGETRTFGEVAEEAKRTVIRDVLATDVSRLTNFLVAVVEGERRYRDFTRPVLHDALVEMLVAYDVYRTYVRPGEPPSPVGAATIHAASRRAIERRPDLDPELFDFLARVLLGSIDGHAATELFVRFQQLSSSVMAKGVEDTAFYRYNRLVSVNEVGADPGSYPTSVAGFHEAMAEAHEHWPDTMLASSTHDTKRSEDVRARLALLSEDPESFATAARRWSAMNARHRKVDGPDANLEWFIYQTLVGAHPLGLDRLLAYVEKASREAKLHTSWTDPVPEYDESVSGFVTAVLGDDEFMADLGAFVEPLVEAGWVNSLAALLIKLTAPGVPDIYQGCELWDFSLVDPDNRREVDFEVRRALLDELPGLSVDEIWKRADDGLPKLWVTTTALALRAERPAAFVRGTAGSYQALEVAGPAADDIVAFGRGGKVVTVVTRRRRSALDGWGQTTIRLPEGRWRNLFADPVAATFAPGRVSGPKLLDTFPVALLVNEAT